MAADCWETGPAAILEVKSDSKSCCVERASLIERILIQPCLVKGYVVTCTSI